MSRQSKTTCSLLLLLGILLGGWLWQKQEGHPYSKPVTRSVEVHTTDLPDNETGTDFSEDLLGGIYQTSDPKRDLELVYNLMESYRMLVKDPNNPYPRGGSNADIVRALTGTNRNKAVFLPPNHVAVNEGQLRDRWGTALHFHYLSGDQVVIRSAGPDLQLGNGDDLTWEM